MSQKSIIPLSILSILAIKQFERTKKNKLVINHRGNNEYKSQYQSEKLYTINLYVYKI